jgi:hypothetical protein
MHSIMVAEWKPSTTIQECFQTSSPDVTKTGARRACTMSTENESILQFGRPGALRGKALKSDSRPADDHRKLAMLQLVLERDLRMIPLLKAQLTNSCEELIDLVVPMAAQPDSVEPEPPVKDPPAEEPPLDDPPSKEPPVEEPGRPAPMKSASAADDNQHEGAFRR